MVRSSASKVGGEGRGGAAALQGARGEEARRGGGARGGDPMKGTVPEVDCMNGRSVETSLPAEALGVGTAVGSVVLDRELERDALGSVWEGRDQAQGGRRVTLRFLPPMLHGDGEFETQLQGALGRLVHETGHPGAPPATALRRSRLDEATRTVVPAALLLEWPQGSSLATVLASARPKQSQAAREAEAAWVAKELGEILVALHGAGAVHGDLCPQNVRVAGAPRKSLMGVRLAVVDAEVSWRVGRAMAAIVGSSRDPWAQEVRSRLAERAAFRAPEVEAGGEPTAASDLYALAAMTVFVASACEDLADGIERMTPGALRRAVEAAMAADPAARPASAEQFLQIAGIHDAPAAERLNASASEPAEKAGAVLCTEAGRIPAGAPAPMQRHKSGVMPLVAGAGWLAAVGLGAAFLWKATDPTPDPKLVASVERLQNELGTSRAELDRARADGKRALGDLEAMRSERAAMEQRIAALDGERRAIEEQVRALPTAASLVTVERARDDERAQARELRARLAERERELEAARGELKVTLQQIADAQMQASSETTSAVASLRRSLEEERKARATAEAERDGLRSERSRLAAALEQAKPKETPAAVPARPTLERLRQSAPFAAAELIAVAPGTSKISESGSEVSVTREVWAWSTEVTRGQYRAFCAAVGRAMPDQPAVPSAWRKLVLEDDLPVVNVSWNDARAFCEWLSNVAGAGFRLPTEAEWARAARGGDAEAGALPSFTASVRNPELLLNSFESPHSKDARQGHSDGAWPAAGVFPDRSHLVDAELADLDRLPTGSGHHFCGNVWEWCADGWYDGDAVRDGFTTKTDPLVPVDRAATLAAVRGGSWREGRTKCNFFSRKPLKLDSTAVDVGFRPVWSASAGK
ncbi:MAG: SUMF1/EgtB/PvdO family nonheme iron enzyme [Planctomycetes bacterium]|nr:SUMF1/EgtB/PvdO family nonheme iron enzyme [Planctomycetota bacterium]